MAGLVAEDITYQVLASGDTKDIVGGVMLAVHRSIA